MGWIDGSMGGWMNEWVDEMDGWMDDIYCSTQS